MGSVNINSKIQVVSSPFKSKDGDVVAGVNVRKGNKQVWMTFEQLLELRDGINALAGTIKANLDEAVGECKAGYKINWDGSSSRPKDQAPEPVQEEPEPVQETQVVSTPTAKTKEVQAESNTQSEVRSTADIIASLNDF